MIRPRTPFWETVLQTAAAMPYLPDAQELAESLGIEPSSASTLLVSNEVAYHLPRSPLALGRRFERRAAGLESACSPRSTRAGKSWRRVGDSNSCALSVRQFSRLLGYPSAHTLRCQRTGRPGEIRTLTPKHWFLRPACLPFHHRPTWSTRQESNLH